MDGTVYACFGMLSSVKITSAVLGATLRQIKNAPNRSIGAAASTKPRGDSDEDRTARKTSERPDDERRHHNETTTMTSQNSRRPNRSTRGSAASTNSSDQPNSDQPNHPSPSRHQQSSRTHHELTRTCHADMNLQTHANGPGRN